MSLASFCSIMVIISKNPIFSILFLILSFFNFSGLLFLLELEFLPVIFLVVYVGAIAVLFLFVLMLLNIKYSELKESMSHYVPVALFLIVVFLFELVTVFFFEFTPLSIEDTHMETLNDFCIFLGCSFDFYSFIFKQSNIFHLGNLFFIKFVYLFIVAAFILLLAMVATITLTLQKKLEIKFQHVYQQVLRGNS